MRSLARCLLAVALIAALAFNLNRTVAQTETPPPPKLPDLIGLSLPEATAKLHQLGITINAITDEQWSSSVGAQPNTIAAQAPPPHTDITGFTSVDLTVWQHNNARLTYNSTSITLINQSDVELSLRRVVFTTTDGRGDAQFTATDWRNRINGRNCMQLWAVPRSGGESRQGCRALQRWLSRTNPSVHFWTGNNGATQFEVRQDGILRGICEIAAGECEFYLAPFTGKSGIAADAAAYLYLNYATDWLVLQNRTKDRWLPLNEITLNNHRIALGDPARYDDLQSNSTFPLLAPGQCIALQRRNAAHPITPDCDAVGTILLAPSDVFWTQAFTVNSRIDGLERTCPPAEGENALCLLPRLKEPE